MAVMGWFKKEHSKKRRTRERPLLHIGTETKSPKKWQITKYSEISRLDLMTSFQDPWFLHVSAIDSPTATDNNKIEYACTLYVYSLVHGWDKTYTNVGHCWVVAIMNRQPLLDVQPDNFVYWFLSQIKNLRDASFESWTGLEYDIHKSMNLIWYY